MSQPRRVKRAKFTLHKNRNQEGARSGSHGSLVTFTPTLTRRGKLTYQEVDASPLYMSTDDESETPRRKVPRTPSDSQGLVFDVGDEHAMAEDGFPTETRTHKVREA